MTEKKFNCSLLDSDKFEYMEEGHIVIEGGIIKEVGEGYDRDGIDAKKYLVMPSFINSHTHVGDSFAKEAVVGLDVVRAVGPEGEKWRLYGKARESSIVSSMRDTVRYMLELGTTLFADFREGGKPGIELLRNALEGIEIRGIILGRDIEIDYADGLGLNVYGLGEIPANRKNKSVAIHAGEEKGEITEALKYEPDIIIHCTHASDEELKLIAEKNISVVVCPRSNAALNVGFPDVQRMLKYGINVSLGTDNVMINSPNMFREMEFLFKYSNLYENLDPVDVLKMATVNAAETYSLNCGIIDKGRDADLIFIDKDALNLKNSRNIVATIVSRCEPVNVRKVMIKGNFVVDKDG